MRIKLMLAGMAALALLATAGCPRNPEGEEATPPPAPVTNNTDINITTETPETPPDEAPAETASGEVGAPVGSMQATPQEGDAAAPPAAPAAEGTTVVVFETTKGNIEITVHNDWAPLGAEHFLKLVNAKFYDGAPWFRVLDGFVAQCGVAADPAMNTQWDKQTIMDEPVKKGNLPGTVCFGKTGMPNSRSTHIFINLADNTGSLDPQGFACFGEVTKGMEVAQQLERVEYGDQAGLAAPGGMDAFKKMFPKADYIIKAYVK